MDKLTFEHEMNRAKTFQGLEPDRAEYWAGYQRGLRRAYHGENFGTAEEHTLWLAAAEDRDPGRRQRGQGYKDGLEGRPKMTKDYCTQNNGDCSTCSLVNYGRDCRNVPVLTVND